MPTRRAGSILSRCSAGYVFASEARRALGFPYGDVFYVDRGSGLDSEDGTEWATAVKTISAASNLCTAGKHDVIILRGTESDSAISDCHTINKAGVHLFGGGALFGIGGASQSVLRVPATIATNITGKNIDPKGVALALLAHDIEVAGIKLYQGVLATENLAMIGSGSAASMYQHISIHDCIFQMDIYGWNASTPARGISLEGCMDPYIGYNQFFWGDHGIDLHPGGGAYTKYALVEENKIYGCGEGIHIGQTMENVLRKNRIMPRLTWNALGVTFVYGERLEANSAENLLEDEYVMEADKTDAYSDAGTLNLLINCKYGVTSGTGSTYT